MLGPGPYFAYAEAHGIEPGGASVKKEMIRQAHAEKRDPTEAEIEAAQSVVVADGLKDPYSAMFSDLWAYDADDLGDDGKTVVVCGKVNAKNSFGGYVGDTDFHALIADVGGSMLPIAAQMKDMAVALCLMGTYPGAEK